MVLTLIVSGEGGGRIITFSKMQLIIYKFAGHIKVMLLFKTMTTTAFYVGFFVFDQFVYVVMLFLKQNRT